MVPLFKLGGRRSTAYYNALKSVIPVMSSLFGDSMFMLFGFMSMFMLVMCLAGAFAALFSGGFSIARNSIWAASSAVKLLFCRNSRRRGVKNKGIIELAIGNSRESTCLIF